ncbi:MAG TPA: Gldg family protein [Gemmatimonadales bacterium]|nr:Gldg family protein [Gemmatimonadales bacterium]
MNVRSIWIIARRELKALFDQPTAYILLVVFTGINAFLFFREIELYNVSSLRPMLDFLPWLLLFLVPAVTMRAVAEDTRAGTLEVVLAQPITELELLLGKYLGQVLFLFIALAITLTLPLGLALGTAPEAGVVVAQYIGAALLAAGLAAVGVWASSVTPNQITAFIVAVFVMFLLLFVGFDPLLVGLPARLGAIAASLGVLSHFTQIGRGVIDLRDAVYFVTLAALFLVLAYFALLSRKLTARGDTLKRLRLGTVLLAVAVVVVNLLGGNIGGRIDLTPGRAFTLAPATRKMLHDLPDLVTIKLFASSALPKEVETTRRDVDDLLRDYRAAGRGKVKVVVADPAADSSARQDARSAGVPPVQFNVLGQGELQVKDGYLGIAVRYADQVKTIPFVQQTNDLEYQLTSDIRSLTHPTRSTIAFGEIGDPTSARAQRSFESLREQLGATYTVRTVQFTDSTIAPDIRVLAFAGTPDSLKSVELDRFRAFLDRGGSMLLMANGMQLSPQGPFATSRSVGWNELLKPYGIAIASDMVYDLASNTQVGIPAQFGQVLVAYPFWVRALSTGRSPVNADVGAVLLPWASQIDTAKAAGKATPLLVTSRAGGVEETTAFIDPTGRLSRDSLRSRIMAVLALPPTPAAGAAAGATPRGRVVVVGSADFASDRFARNSPANIVFVQNAMDWLAQEDDLITIRSKNRAPPPLVFTSAATRGVAKYGNLIGVPALLIAAGIVRLLRRRRTTRRTYTPLTGARPQPGDGRRKTDDLQVQGVR